MKRFLAFFLAVEMLIVSLAACGKDEPEETKAPVPTFDETLAASAAAYEYYWSNGGAIDLSGSTDERWFELERKIVLSQYLMAVQSRGSWPCAESGLMFIDMWRGQFHMEMTWWHIAHYALWSRMEWADEQLSCFRKFLPMAKKLAAQLGVSRTPVREAIHLLEKESLVRQIPHKGVVVAGITKKQLRDVLEIRGMLEELAVQLACRRGTEEGFAKLQAAADNFAKAVKQEKDLTVQAEKDVAFHDVIYQMTDNERLIELVESIWQQIYRYRIERLKGANRESLVQEHQELVQALCARDEEAAVRMARLHISNQEVTISKLLEK